LWDLRSERQIAVTIILLIFEHMPNENPVTSLHYPTFILDHFWKNI